MLYRLVPPSSSPNFLSPQILAQLFAHVCSNNYSFTALFESPEISLSDIPSRVGDVVICSSTSGALKLLWSYLQGKSSKGKCREHSPVGHFEGKEDSEQAKLVQLVFQVLLIIVKTSIPNLFTVASELPDLSEFLLERLYGPEQKRKYAITFPWIKGPDLKEESEEEIAIMEWQGPNKELRSIYLALLKRMLEANVDQKVTWRLFGLVRRTNEVSKPTAVETPASTSNKSTPRSPLLKHPILLLLPISLHLQPPHGVNQIFTSIQSTQLPKTMKAFIRRYWTLYVMLLSRNGRMCLCSRAVAGII